MKKNKNHEPIIWKEGDGPLHEFFEVAYGIGHEYVIYVQDATGDKKSVWSCIKDDLLQCFESFSGKCYFGRIQPIWLALTFGFDDQDVTNIHSYGDIEPRG